MALHEALVGQPPSRADGVQMSALWLGGGAGWLVLGARLEDAALWGAERALHAGDLDGRLALHARAGVWVLVVGLAGWRRWWGWRGWAWRGWWSWARGWSLAGDWVRWL